MTVFKKSLAFFLTAVVMLMFSACEQNGEISETDAISDMSVSEVFSDVDSSEAVSGIAASEVTSDTTGSVVNSDAAGSGESPDVISSKEISDMTTFEVIADMGIGINLGNTMEACGAWIDPSGGVKSYETAWGSPEITESVIKGYADCGFGVLRIPVAWSNLMTDDYTINAELMARVKQITEWTVNRGMYAIVNIHWDNGWWEKFPVAKDECMKKYTRIWEQIAEGFGEFDERVMFESLNEEGGWNSIWNRYSGAGDKEGSYRLLNEINQRFVDIVRASGGNNRARHLLIAGYATDIDLTCDPMFKMPNDPQSRCAVSVHYYTPSGFCILKEDADWGKLQTIWGSADDIELLVRNMDNMKETFVDKGVPVIIGEFSVCEKQVKEAESVHRYLTAVVKEASARKMCPILWDITGDYYDRTNCKFIDGELLNEMKTAMIN